MLQIFSMQMLKARHHSEYVVCGSHKTAKSSARWQLIICYISVHKQMVGTLKERGLDKGLESKTPCGGENWTRRGWNSGGGYLSSGSQGSSF